MYRIFDSHCHIYPEKIAQKAVEAVDRFYDGLPADHYGGTVDELLKTGKAAGIEKFVVHSVATKPEQCGSISRFIADSVRQSGGAFIGLGAMHPDSEQPEKDLDLICELGLKGVKLHPDIQQFQADSPKAFALYEMIADRHLPVLIHAGDFRYDYSNPKRIAAAARAFPDLTLIAAHLGGWSMWDEAAALLPDYPNLMADTSSCFPYMTPERAREIIRIFGSERIMFGTDYPMWTQMPDLEFMKKLELEEEEYERIYWKNCAQLYSVR